MGLLLTLLLGLFIIIGALIVFLTENNNKFIEFSISLAFGVMTMLILTDLLPEVIEIIDTGNIILNIIFILLGILLGFILLKILDYFIPEHDSYENLEHIGFVSSIALIVHNILEGTAIYLLVNSDLKAGLMASIAVGLHNIPLGMVITSTFYNSNKSIKKTLIIIFLISLSTFIGGMLCYLFNLSSISYLVEGISLTLTIGMLLYIIIMELLPKILNNKNKNITIFGIIIGVFLLLITLLI